MHVSIIQLGFKNYLASTIHRRSLSIRLSQPVKFDILFLNSPFWLGHGHHNISAYLVHNKFNKCTALVLLSLL